MARTIRHFMFIALIAISTIDIAFSNENIYTIKSIGIKISISELDLGYTTHPVYKVLAVQEGGAAYLGGIQPGDTVFNIRFRKYKIEFPAYYINNENNQKKQFKILEVFDKKIKLGDMVTFDLKWLNGKSPKHKEYTFLYRNNSDGDWISSGGTRGVIPANGRPNLPGFAEAKAEIESAIEAGARESAQQEHEKNKKVTELSKEFQNEILSVDFSECSTAKVDKLLDDAGISHEKLTESIFSTELVPSLKLLSDERKGLERCVRETSHRTVVFYQVNFRIIDAGEQFNDKFLNNTFALATNREWQKRYGEISGEVAKAMKVSNTSNNNAITVLDIFDRGSVALTSGLDYLFGAEFANFVETNLKERGAKSNPVAITKNSARGRYYMLRQKYLERVLGKGEAYEILVSEGFVPEDSDKTDREIIEDYIAAVERHEEDLKSLSSEIERRIKTIEESDVYGKTMLQALFEGASALEGSGESGFDSDISYYSNMLTVPEKLAILNKRLWRLRAALNANVGKICNAPRAIRYCTYSENTTTSYVGKGMLYDYTDVTNTCSGACSGVNGWCDLNSGDIYSSYLDAENSNCQNASIEMIRGELYN